MIIQVDASYKNSLNEYLKIEDIIVACVPFSFQYRKSSVFYLVGFEPIERRLYLFFPAYILIYQCMRRGAVSHFFLLYVCISFYSLSHIHAQSTRDIEIFGGDIFLTHYRYFKCGARIWLKLFAVYLLTNCLTIDRPLLG